MGYILDGNLKQKMPRANVKSNVKVIKPESKKPRMTEDFIFYSNGRMDRVSSTVIPDGFKDVWYKDMLMDLNTGEILNERNTK